MLSKHLIFSRLVFLKKHSIPKKSQIHTQIFVYILTIIIFSFILIYGYNAIKGFRERSEQIAYIKFKTDLVSTVKRISPDYGTVKKEEFFIGGDYSKVCFVQSYGVTNKADLLKKISESDKVVEDSVKSGVNKNVFLFSPSGLQESFDVGPINVSNGYKCIAVINGRAKVQFEGRGDNTYISEWGG